MKPFVDQLPLASDHLSDANPSESTPVFALLLARYKARVYEAYSWDLVNEWNQSDAITSEGYDY